jgi:hypothetical protein
VVSDPWSIPGWERGDVATVARGSECKRLLSTTRNEPPRRVRSLQLGYRLTLTLGANIVRANLHLLARSALFYSEAPQVGRN